MFDDRFDEKFQIGLSWKKVFLWLNRLIDACTKPRQCIYCHPDYNLRNKKICDNFFQFSFFD